MFDPISLPIWHLVVFILGGVALGAVVALLSAALSSDGRGSPASRPQSAGNPVRKPVGASGRSTGESTSVKPGRLAALPASKQEFLDRCVAQRRSLTVDRAAELLDVSRRQIRRWLDSGDLKAVLVEDGTRRVVAVSVHDFIVRQLTGQSQKAAPTRRKPAVEAEGKKREEDTVDSPEEESEPVQAPRHKTAVDAEGSDAKARARAEEKAAAMGPKPQQQFWYYVQGHSTPYHTIREALIAMGLAGAGFAWRELPTEIRAQMQRIRVQ